MGVVALAVAAELLLLDDLLRDAGVDMGPSVWLTRSIAMVTAIAGGGLAVLVWRVLAPLELTEASDTTNATLRAMIELGDPDELARRAQGLLWNRESWVIRRVEHVEFTDRTMVRRHVSVDFRMPNPVEITFAADGTLSDEALELLAGTRIASEEQRAPAFVPISVLRGWPPVLNLDLRGPRGEPLPLLSKAATNALDARVLYVLATQAFQDFADDLGEPLDTLVHEDGLSAIAAYYVFRKGVDRIRRRMVGLDEEKARRVEELARALVHGTLLWTPATAEPGTRTIVKLAYDEPLIRHLGSAPRSLLATVGLRSVAAGFEVGQVGDAGSYHLEITLPAPLSLVSADLMIATSHDAATPRWIRRQWEQVGRRWRVLIDGLELRIAASLNRPWPISVDRTNHSQVYTRRAHLYTSGQPSRTALALLKVVPERRGAPLAGAVTAGLVALLLQLTVAYAGEIYAQRERPGVLGATLALLLLAPPTTAFVLSRGIEHALVARALAGVRALTVSSILLCVAAAGALVIAVVDGKRSMFVSSLPTLRTVAVAIALVLTAGLALPLGRRWRLRD